MGERQPRRVEGEPRKRGVHLPAFRIAEEFPGRAAVTGVADHRVPPRREVHANLVGAPGDEVDFEQRRAGEHLGRAVDRRGLARVGRAHRHLGWVATAAADRIVDPSGRRFRAPPHEGEVGLVDLAPREHRRKLAVRRVGLGDEQQARGVFVQAVHDPRAVGASRGGERQVLPQQGVHERALARAVSRVDHQTRRFHDDGEMRVFEDDPDRDVLADEVRRRGFGNRGRDRHAGLEHQAGFSRLASIDVDAPVLDEALPHGSRWTGMLRREEGVEPHARGVVGDVEADALGGHAVRAMRTRSRMRKNAPIATAATLNNWEVETKPPSQRPLTESPRQISIVARPAP